MSGSRGERAAGRVNPTGGPPGEDVDAGGAWIEVFRSRAVWELDPALVQRWIERNRIFYRYVRQAVATEPGGPRVLELGCGPGRHAIAMATFGAQVTAVDVDPRIIDQARVNAARCGVAARVRFHLGDMDDYLDSALTEGTSAPGAPEQEPTIEVVTHGGLMEHFASVDAVRASLTKQLQVASVVVFDVPTGSPKNRALFERDDIFRQDWSTQQWVDEVLAPFDLAAWAVDDHEDPSMTDDLVVMLRGRPSRSPR